MKKLLILLTALAMVSAFAMSAAAAEWNFYGSARLATFSDDDDAANSGTGFDDQDTTWAVQGNSRIGANVTVSETLSGRFEYGTGVNTRLLYGVWDFGGGKLLVGQDYTPISGFAPVTGMRWGSDGDLNGLGNFLQKRRSQIKLMFENFQIAFTDPAAAEESPSDGIVGAYADLVDNDPTFPGISASYTLPLNDFVTFKVAGAYKTMDVVDTNDQEYSIDAYLAAASVTLNYEAFSMNGTIGVGQNIDNLDLYNGGLNRDVYGSADFDGNDIVDTDAIAYTVSAGFKVNDMVSFGAGFGYTDAEQDGAADSDETCAFFVNAPITLAQGVYVTPEIGKIDYKDDAAGNDEGDTVYFGAQWKINF